MDSIRIDWSAENSKYIDWNDGHTPESFDSSDTGGLRIYPEFHDPSHSFIRTVPDAGPQWLVDAIYNFTIQQVDPTWGAYVLWEDAKNAALKQAHEPTINATTESATLDKLALQAAAVFVQQQFPSFQPHGVAVWALAANTGSCVPYHVDYAEWLRYRYNITVLPILAGTWQCTRDEANMEGGEFWAHQRGLDHYKVHGYKAALCPIDGTENDWVKIPYRFNQLIIQSGELPHLSTTVDSIEENWKRVIVGFNVFLKDVGPLVQESPEHSEAFRARVQTMRLQQQRRRSIQRMSQQMKRMLVLAKRQKIKEDYGKAKDQLDRLIKDHFDHESEQVSTQAELVSCAAVLISEGHWPCNEDDIKAYLSQRCNDGFLLKLDDDAFTVRKGVVDH